VLPDISGFEVLDQLRARPETAEIPVIVNTAKTLTADERERLTSAVDVLTKDLPTRQVAIHRIKEALDKVGATPPRPAEVSHG
jgi:CheY-like chemotaxis protein